MPDYSGQSAGRYPLLQKLDDGVLVATYKAMDTRLDRKVLVRLIQKDNLENEIAARVNASFETEARFLASLNNTHIAQILDYGDFSGFPYLVTQHWEGSTLAERIGTPVPYAEAASLLAPVAHALAYAHQRGMMHLDVQPGNIVITDTGQAVLTGFEAGRLFTVEELARLARLKGGIGCVEYLAPEMWTRNAGAASDQYSLGVLLYEMITMRKPYRARTPAVAIMLQANDPPQRPGMLVENLPLEVEQVILKALAVKPEERFPDMGTLAQALEEMSTTTHQPVTRVNETPAEIYTGHTAPAPAEHPTTVQPAPKKTRPWYLQKMFGVGIGFTGICLVFAFLMLLFRDPGPGPMAFLVAPTSTNTPTQTQAPTATRLALITPTRTPASIREKVEGQESLYSQDFASRFSEWSLIPFEDDMVKTIFQIDNGVFSWNVHALQGVNFRGNPMPIVMLPEGDFLLAVNTQIHSEDNAIAAGLVFRLQENGNCYYAKVSGGGEVSVFAWEDDKWVPLVTPVKSEHFLRGEPNRLVVIQQNGSYEVQVNDYTEISFSNPLYKKGAFGIAVELGAGMETDFTFDDLLLMRLDG